MNKEKIYFRNNYIYEISWGHLRFRDSYLLLQFPLNVLGKEFLSEGKVNFSIEEITLKNYREEYDKIEEYTCKDVDLLKGVITKFQKEFLRLPGYWPRQRASTATPLSGCPRWPS